MAYYVMVTSIWTKYTRKNRAGALRRACPPAYESHLYAYDVTSNHKHSNALRSTSQHASWPQLIPQLNPSTSESTPHLRTRIKFLCASEAIMDVLRRCQYHFWFDLRSGRNAPVMSSFSLHPCHPAVKRSLPQACSKYSPQSLIRFTHGGFPSDFWWW